MEELKSQQQKDIINEILKDLSHQQIDLYYTDSNTIAHMIETYIKEGKLNRHKFEIVKDLNKKDILILMSYNSSCC